MYTELVESLKKLMTAHCDMNNASHDNRYYTRSQINALLGTSGEDDQPSTASHNHTVSQITDLAAWAKEKTKPSYNWDEIGNKPSVFPVASHNHDNNYLSLTGGTVTGDVCFDNGHSVIMNAISTNGYYDAGLVLKPGNNASSNDAKAVKIGAIGAASQWGCIRIGFANVNESTSELANPSDGLILDQDNIRWNGKRLLTEDDNTSDNDNYLPLTGGTMTGSIDYNANDSSWVMPIKVYAQNPNNNSVNSYGCIQFTTYPYEDNNNRPYVDIRPSWTIKTNNRLRIGFNDGVLWNKAYMLTESTGAGGKYWGSLSEEGPSSHNIIDMSGWVSIMDFAVNENYIISLRFQENNGQYITTANETYMFILSQIFSGEPFFKLISKSTGNNVATKAKLVYSGSILRLYLYLPNSVTTCVYANVFGRGASPNITSSMSSGASKEIDLTADISDGSDEWKYYAGLAQNSEYAYNSTLINHGPNIMSKTNSLSLPSDISTMRNCMIGSNNSIYLYATNINTASLLSNNYIIGGNNRIGAVSETDTNTYNSAIKMCNMIVAGMYNAVAPGIHTTSVIGLGNTLHHNHPCTNSSNTSYGQNTIVGVYNNFENDSNFSANYLMTNVSIFGNYNTVDGANSSVLLGNNHRIENATGSYCIGDSNSITGGSYSGAMGKGNTIKYQSGYAVGMYLIPKTGQTAIGHYNSISADSNATVGISTGTAFMIGNGSPSSRSNAFRVTGDGKVYSTSGSISTGADYAEYFEYADGNPNRDDRVGYFVTFDSGRKIRFATSEDTFILGITSGNPVVIGNGDECWAGRFERDLFDRLIVEEVEELLETGEVDTDGNPIYAQTTVTKWKENNNYDPNQKYVHRCDRPEWDTVGMLGILAVYDNGECSIDGYCTVGDNGIAVPCEYQWGPKCYRVLERLSNNIIRVLFRN